MAEQEQHQEPSVAVAETEQTAEAEMLQPPPLLEMLLEQHAALHQPVMPSRIEGIVVGRIERVEEDGSARVSFPSTPLDGVPARSMMALTEQDVGRTIAIMFEASDSTRPVVMGPIVTPSVTHEGEPYVARSDGRRVDISAAEEIVLRCGDASITLTRGGKVEIRGEYVLSRSAGVNRIQGGAVEVN